MTAGDIITAVQADYEDLPTAKGLALLQRVYDQICQDFPLDKTTVNLTSIVSGTGEYALDEAYVSIGSALWVRTSADNDFRVLEELNPDQLDEEDAGWRVRPTSEPYGYAIEGGNIVLVRRPNVSSSGGYPRVRLDLYKSQTLSTGTTLPTSVRRPAVFENGVRYLWAQRRDKQNAKFWGEMYEEDLKDLERYMKKRQRRARNVSYAENYMNPVI